MKPPDVNHRYYDGRHSDVTNVLNDLPFWSEQAQTCGDPILELACGTGRVTLFLAKEGFKVAGIDVSNTMLAHAKKKDDKNLVKWIKGDIRDFDLGERYALIIFPFNTICHLYESEDLEGCLSCVKRHLKQGGRFVIDVFNPDLSFLIRDPEKRHPHAEYPDPDGKGKIFVTESNVYDSAAQINRITLYYKLPGQAEEVTDTLNMRIYFPQEIDALLRCNGFVIEKKYGDCDRSPFGPGSKKQIIVSSVKG